MLQMIRNHLFGTKVHHIPINQYLVNTPGLGKKGHRGLQSEISPSEKTLKNEPLFRCVFRNTKIFHEDGNNLAFPLGIPQK